MRSDPRHRPEAGAGEGLSGEGIQGKARAGLWIDRNRAVIVRIPGGGTETETEVLLSGVSSKVKGRGGARSHTRYGPQDVSGERSAQDRREQQLRRFYGNVVSRLSGTSAVLVVGPGLTKHHFSRVASRRGITLAALRPAGSLTDRQLVAEVREFFRSLDQERPHTASR